MNSTGKKARRRFGTRAACKRAKARRRSTKDFGKLPYSVVRGNAHLAVEANDRLLAEVARLRREKYGSKDVPYAV